MIKISDNGAFQINSDFGSSVNEGTAGGGGQGRALLFSLTQTTLTYSSLYWEITSNTGSPADFWDPNSIYVSGSPATNFPSGFGLEPGSFPFRVYLNADSLTEGDETFEINFYTSAAFGTLVAGASFTVIDDDPQQPSTVSIIADAAGNAEGGAGTTTPFTFSVTRSGAISGGLTLNYSVAPGALRPAAAADFAGGVLPSGSISFGPGQTSTTLTINVAGDNVLEGNEDFVVTLAPAPGATLATASAGTTILEDDPITDMVVLDGKSGQPVAISPTFYAGPVAGVQREFIMVTPENLTIAVAGPNWFIHSGSGDDAIQVAGGVNVLDGGTGSNFLTGASGFDTFFIDARGAASDIWSTVNNFSAGDAITLWGVSEAAFSLSWRDDEGANGFKGLTLHATAPGKATASLTLPGLTIAEAGAGALTISFGHDAGSGSDYIYIVAN